MTQKRKECKARGTSETVGKGGASGDRSASSTNLIVIGLQSVQCPVQQETFPIEILRSVLSAETLSNKSC